MAAPAAAAASKGSAAAASSSAITAGQVAAAAAPAVGSVFGLIGAKRRMKYQNKLNSELTRYQNELNIQQWERENEYNSPKNQMARLAEAGINPRMAFGDSASSSAASSPTLQAPQQGAAPQLGEYVQDFFGKSVNAINAVNQIRMQEEQMKMIQAQTRMYDVNASLNEVKTRLGLLDEIIKGINSSRYDLTWKQNYKLKSWALNHSMANYLSTYGVGSLDLNDTDGAPIVLPYGTRAVNLYGDFGDPSVALNKRKTSGEIGLLLAKATQAAAESRNKEAATRFINRKIISQDLIDNLTRENTKLSYRKRQSEIQNYYLLLGREMLQDSTRKLIDSKTDYQNTLNGNYLPLVGDISAYPQILLRNLRR